MTATTAVMPTRGDVIDRAVTAVRGVMAAMAVMACSVGSGISIRNQELNANRTRRRLT